MVDPFKLIRKNEDNTITYTADNITSINMDCSTPLTPMPIPQSPDSANILIKVEGNQTTINIGWKIRNLGTGNSPFDAEETMAQATNAVTALKIVEFFKDHFVPITVDDSFTLHIGDEIEVGGTLMKMSFTVSASSPVVWDGILQFVVGTVAASTDSNYADAPTYTSIVDASGNTDSITINGITTSYFGLDTGITGYKIRYKRKSPSPSSSWSSVTHTTTDATSQDITVDINGSAGEKYDIKITAKTDTHPENIYTQPVSVTLS